MFKPARPLIWILAFSLTACGGDEPASLELEASGSPSTASGTSMTSPLETLTADRLDAYIEILRAGQADLDKDAFDIALKRGWRAVDWTWLHEAVRSVTADGGFDPMLERIRKKQQSVGKQIAEYEARLDSAPADQRPMFEKAIQTLKKATAGWTKTLSNADSLRAGGRLIESRMADIKTAQGK